MSPNSARVAGMAAAGLLALGFSAPAAWAETGEEEGLAEAAVTAAQPAVLPEHEGPEAPPEPEPVLEEAPGPPQEAQQVQILQEEDPPPEDPPPTDPPPEDPPPTDPPPTDPPPTDPPPTDPPPTEPPPTDPPPTEPPPTDPPPAGEPPGQSPPAASGPSAELTETDFAPAEPPTQVSSAGGGLPVTGPELGPLVVAGVAISGLGAAAAFAARRREGEQEG